MRHAISWHSVAFCDPAIALTHYTLAEQCEATGDIEQAHRHLCMARAALAGMSFEFLLDSPEMTTEMVAALVDYRAKDLTELDGGAPDLIQ
jgi:hypothetical protein